MKKATYLKKIGIFTLYCFLIILSLHVTIKLNTRITSATLSGEIAHAAIGSTQHEYLVYIFYDPKETIILQDNDANYPEVSFVTFIAMKYDASTGSYDLYDGSDGPISMELMCIDKNREKVPHQIVSLTDNGLCLWNPPKVDQFDGTLSWRGFYNALGEGGIESLKGALDETNTSNGKKTTLDRLEFRMGESTGAIVVAAVKTWHYLDIAVGESNTNPDEISLPSLGYSSKPTIQHLVFKAGESSNPDFFYFEGDIAPTDVVLNGSSETSSFDLKLNTDNVNFKRRNIDGDPSKFSRVSDPGPFVVVGTSGRLYDDIIEILVEKAESGEQLPNGGRHDSAQVSFAYIYNNPPNDHAKKVFKCVREIVAQKLPGKILARIVTKFPYRVIVNPYSKSIRFNGEAVMYSFVVSNARTAVAFHEASHCFEHLGEGIADKDKDGLIVYEVPVKVGSEYKHFVFCEDIKERGWIKISGSIDVAYGDNEKHANIKRSHFVSTSFDIKQRLGVNDIPVKDLPFRYDLDGKRQEGKLYSKKMIFYDPVKKKKPKSTSNPFNKKAYMIETRLVQKFHIGQDKEPLVNKKYGWYRPMSLQTFSNNMYTGSDEDSKEIIDDLIGQGFKVYAITSLNLKAKPNDYDAQMFAITHGEVPKTVSSDILSTTGAPHDQMQ